LKLVSNADHAVVKFVPSSAAPVHDNPQFCQLCIQHMLKRTYDSCRLALHVLLHDPLLLGVTGLCLTDEVVMPAAAHRVAHLQQVVWVIKELVPSDKQQQEQQDALSEIVKHLLSGQDVTPDNPALSSQVKECF
jgi:hypothetical protein